MIFTCPRSNSTGPAQFLVARGDWATISFKHCWQMPTMQIWSHWSTPISSSWFKLSGMWLYMAEISICWNQRHPNWSYQDPYFVPRTADYLPPLWSSADHWPYASWVCNVTGESWRLLHSWLTGYSLRDSSWDLHSGVPTRGGILLSDLNDQTCNIIPDVYHPWIDAVCFNFYYPRPQQAWLICIENESSFERLVPV